MAEHQCCCVAINLATGEKRHCTGLVISSDIPFCRTCEDRHPNFSPYIQVTAALPGVKNDEGERNGNTAPEDCE